MKKGILLLLLLLSSSSSSSALAVQSRITHSCLKRVLIPIEMSSLFRLFHTFSTPFSFHFLVSFYEITLILILFE